jgi:glycosyltransferase involved in cell wall biosynthesis
LILPTFTVVMRAYNASSRIAEAIASVLAQTREDTGLLGPIRVAAANDSP